MYISALDQFTQRQGRGTWLPSAQAGHLWPISKECLPKHTFKRHSDTKLFPHPEPIKWQRLFLPHLREFQNQWTKNMSSVSSKSISVNPFASVYRLQWTFLKKCQWNATNVLSCLGCLRLPAGANFPLNYMVKYAPFDRLPLPHIGQFNIYMHGDLKFLNQVIFVNHCGSHVQQSVPELWGEKIASNHT